MKTKLQKLLIAIAVLLVSANAFAHDFEIGGIYYSITSYTNRTVEVTHEGSSSEDGDYSGNVIIPAKVIYNAKEYSVTHIASFAFRKSTSLTSVTIPNSVTTIGNCAFSDCDGLTSVIIPNSVTSIGSSVFSGCTGLTSITIPNSVTSIGDYAFYNCYRLTLGTIPNSVTSIGDYAFYNCDRLSSVTIHRSLTSIGDNAFYDCDGLGSVTITNSVTSIGDNVFYDCSIKKVIWLTNTPPSGYTNIKSIVNYVANDQYSGLSNVKVYPYLSSMFEVDGIKYVPVSPSERTCDAIDCAYDATATNINLGQTVSYKGIEMTLNEVQPYTCYNNDYIKDVNIDISGDISEYCFYDCDNIKSATIKASTIGNYAFYGCTAIKKATINADTIGAKVFLGCTGMVSVTLGDRLKSIGASAFYNCSNLKSVTIPNAVESLRGYTFYGCSSLPEITIPSNVTSIGDYVFDGCTSLANVTFEDRDTELSLGSNGSSPMFSDCPLKSVYIGGNISYPTSSDYGYSPFYRNTTLESVTITDKETEISENEFYGCSSLKNITMGNGVESIGNWAFSGCSSLDYFSFGSGMKTIGEEAFSDCTAMTKLISHAITPPTCGTQALDDINKWTCELFVPGASIAKYQTADQWKEFFFVSEVGAGINDVVADNNEIKVVVDNGNIVLRGVDSESVEVYTVGGMLVYRGCDTSILVASGMYIVKVNGKAYKVVV